MVCDEAHLDLLACKNYHDTDTDGGVKTKFENSLVWSARAITTHSNRKGAVDSPGWQIILRGRTHADEKKLISIRN